MNTESATEVLEHKGHQITTRVIRDARDICDIRDSWLSWLSHPNSDLDFYLSVLRTKSAVQQPYVLVLYRDSLPIAIMVGRIESVPFECRIGYKTLFKPKVRVLSFVYGGALGEMSVEVSDIALDQIMASLRNEEADVVIFRCLNLVSPLYAAAINKAGALSRDYMPIRQIHRSVQLPRGAEEFHRTLSRKTRKNPRHARLLKDFAGRVNIRCFSETSELEIAIRDVESIAKHTYQRGLGVGFVNDGATQQRLYLEAQKGWLRVHILYLADVPCAFWIGTLYQGTYHSDFLGYDPSYRKYSPGMFLIVSVMGELSSSKNVRTVDWGLGDAMYKETLSDAKWEEASVHIFAPTMTGVKLNLMRTPPLLLEHTCRNLLQRTALVAKLKRAWRNWVQDVPSSADDSVQV